MRRGNGVPRLRVLQSRRAAEPQAELHWDLHQGAVVHSSHGRLPTDMGRALSPGMTWIACVCALLLLGALAAPSEAKFFHHQPAGCTAWRGRRHGLLHPPLRVAEEDAAACRKACYALSFPFFAAHADGTYGCACLKSCIKADVRHKQPHLERADELQHVKFEDAPLPMAPPPASILHQTQKWSGHEESHLAGNKDYREPSIVQHEGMQAILRHVGRFMPSWH